MSTDPLEILDTIILRGITPNVTRAYIRMHITYITLYTIINRTQSGQKRFGTYSDKSRKDHLSPLTGERDQADVNGSTTLRQ